MRRPQRQIILGIIVDDLKTRGYAAKHLGYGNATLADRTITATLKDLDNQIEDGKTMVIVTAHCQQDLDAQGTEGKTFQNVIDLLSSLDGPREVIFCKRDERSVMAPVEGTTVLYLDQVPNANALPEGVLEALQNI